MMLIWLLLFFVSFPWHIHGVDAELLSARMRESIPPFTYPLQCMLYPSPYKDAEVTVCFHGHGGDYQIGEIVSANVKEHTIGFNFPDAGVADLPSVANRSAYGTIQELLPALYVINTCIDAGNLDTINLYGFSAGGGAVVNVIAVLQRSDYDNDLATIGIRAQEKKKILKAIQNGYVILDCPLKSVEELIDARGHFPQLDAFAANYATSRLRPIDSLKDLTGLKLHVFLNFQDPDSALTNRDDELYAERLREANRQGITVVVKSCDDGHTAYHPKLWEALARKTNVESCFEGL